MHRLTITFQVALIVLVSGVGLSLWGDFLLKLAHSGDIPSGWATLIGSFLGAVAAVGASVWAAQHQVRSQLKASEQARQDNLRVAAQLIILELERYSQGLKIFIEAVKKSDKNSIVVDDFVVKQFNMPFCEQYLPSTSMINVNLARSLQNILYANKTILLSTGKNVQHFLHHIEPLHDRVLELTYWFQGYIETGSTSTKDLNRFAKKKAAEQKAFIKNKKG
jgi:hypothetical protein